MISVIVTAHRESLLIHRTLKSVYAAIDVAEQVNLTCELVIALDRGDQKTRRYIHQFPIQRHRIVEVDAGDPGIARNAGASHATGKYVAYLDGDDMFCPQWLVAAYKYAESARIPRLVLHPEYNVCFEATNCLVQYDSCPKPGVSSLGLAIVNYWTSIIFLRQTMLAERPFAHLPPESGFGYEDWHVVAEQMALGAEVHVVPGTCNFIRRKRFNSVLARHSESKAVLPPTTLLDPVRIAKEEAPNTAPPPRVRGLRKVKREVKRVFRQVMPRRVSEAVLRPEPTPQAPPHFVVEACRAVHAIEPKVYPSAQQFSIVYHPMEAGLGAAEQYRMLCRSCNSRPTHVFLAPWLKKGGADLVTLHYIQAICEASDRNRVAVITTYDADSPWSTRLPPDVSLIPFGQICRDLDAALRTQLLATFLVQLQPDVIHNINSGDGFIVFRDHGAALQHRSRMFACAFCEDITEEGRVVGYAFDHLADCFPYLSGVLTENERIIDKLVDQFGFDRDKFYLHYQPTAPIVRKPKKPSDRLSVLWAGRLDRQKRPDLLKAIAEQLQGSAIDLNFYGSSMLDQTDETNRWSSLPNLFYRGPFDRFESLPLDEFDVFLHTAHWDGMPNVLLEAAAAGLAIVASGVGGIPELIETGVTGFCVTPYDDVTAYCQALLTLHADQKKLARLAAAGKELVDYRHSWAAFQRAISRVPGYLTPQAFSAKREHAGMRAA
jgi:glycosyltransferase involved in cell wall biosynthesis